MEDREALLGREWKTVWKDGAGVVYRKYYGDYTVEHLEFSTDLRFGLRRNFAYRSEERDYACDGSTPCRVRRTTYAYDLAMQGGAQWGNLTTVREYDEDGVLYRTDRKWYFPNTSR